MPMVEVYSGTATIPYAMSEWTGPTGTYFSYSGYPDGGYGYPAPTYQPTSASSLGHTTGAGGMTRGSNYFFGFLITFLSLLLTFIACGIGSRRRLAARRRRQMEMEHGRMIRFGGLLGGPHTDESGRRLTNAEILKHKPTYHEIWLSSDEGKSHVPAWDEKLGFQKELQKGSDLWSNIKPISATLLRTPGDLQTYQHFNNAFASGAMEHARQDTTANAIHHLPQETLPQYEAVGGSAAWYNRIFPVWTPHPDDMTTGAPTASNESDAANEKTNGRDSRSGSLPLDATEDIEVAVMVVMPSEFKPSNKHGREYSQESLEMSITLRPIPECQIGITRGRVVGSGEKSQSRIEC